MALGSVASGAGTSRGVGILLIDDTAILRDRRERPWFYFDTIKYLALIIVPLLPLALSQKPSIATVCKRSEYRYKCSRHFSQRPIPSIDTHPASDLYPARSTSAHLRSTLSKPFLGTISEHSQDRSLDSYYRGSQKGDDDTCV